MIGYIVSYNGRDNDIIYKVGGTYTYNGKISINSGGFLFYRYAKAILDTHDTHSPNFRVFRVEVLGEVLDVDDISITDKIKVLDMVSVSEYCSLFGGIHDINGNKIKEVCPNGNVIRYEYDENNNRIKKIYLSGKVHSYTYNENNKLIQEIDVGGGVHRYEYDQEGSRIKETLDNKAVYTIDIDYPSEDDEYMGIKKGDKCLVRNSENDEWVVGIFISEDTSYKVIETDPSYYLVYFAGEYEYWNYCKPLDKEMDRSVKVKKIYPNGEVVEYEEIYKYDKENH